MPDLFYSGGAPRGDGQTAGSWYTSNLIYRLVWENLKHRPVRTLLSAIFIGIQVTLILTLVGVSRGVLDDIAQRSRGTGADILIRPPNSTVFSLSGNMSNGAKRVDFVRKVPHVAMATGTLVIGIANFENITGINLDEFNAMSGGFKYVSGGPFQHPDDILIDTVYARSKNLQVGDPLPLGHLWHVCGIVESGMMSRMFAQIEQLQDLYSDTDQVNVIYVKADKPENIQGVLMSLISLMEDYKIYTMEEFVSLLTVNNYPLIKNFTNVVMGIAVIVGFFVVLLTMYTAVLERTREIGILKALGASPGYILGILMRGVHFAGSVGHHRGHRDDFRH